MSRSRRSSEPSTGHGSVFGQGSSWGTLSNSEAWSFPSPSAATAGPPDRLVRRRRFARIATPILLGLVFAANGFRVGTATSGHSVLSAILIGAGLIAATLGLVAWTMHRARRRNGAFPARNVVWAIRSGAVVGGIVIAVVFGVFGRGVGTALGDQYLAVPGTPGYSTFSGPAGKPMAVGSPWGKPCQPVVLWVAKGVPDAVYDEVQQVVTEAREAGVDVTLENRRQYWFPPELYPRVSRTPT